MQQEGGVQQFECCRCGECVGFSCPVDAKNGSHNTVLPRALATGNAELVPGCRAAEITTDPDSFSAVCNASKSSAPASRASIMASSASLSSKSSVITPFWLNKKPTQPMLPRLPPNLSK